FFVGFDYFRSGRFCGGAGAGGEGDGIRFGRFVVDVAEVGEAGGVDAEPIVGVGLELHFPNESVVVLPARLIDEIWKDATAGIDHRSSAGAHGLVEDDAELGGGGIDVFLAVVGRGFNNLWRSGQ